jgi:hypothetical protein
MSSSAFTLALHLSARRSRASKKATAASSPSLRSACSGLKARLHPTASILIPEPLPGGSVQPNLGERSRTFDSHSCYTSGASTRKDSCSIGNSVTSAFKQVRREDVTEASQVRDVRSSDAASPGGGGRHAPRVRCAMTATGPVADSTAIALQ